ncbi:MAG: DUF1844 domain-containing protein [Elusimicrobia bacterium]|nr:DUF1844 domain-containing protein [Elusimicrobiota bacterium]MBU2614213.1 DUF1844 domain-containing protein [Elusimicrobiota bacterium]
MDKNFIGLIISLSAGAWQHLGKIENPITGKIEKNMENAKMSIDILEMLKEKTKGNLSAEEEKLLDNTLADLKLNYVEELKSDGTSGTTH